MVFHSTMHHGNDAVVAYIGRIKGGDHSFGVVF